MTKTFAFAALAATLSFAAPALAQAPAAGTPAPSKAAPTATSEPAAPATGTSSDTAATASASASVTTGMSVKDNTGALIGEVKNVAGGVATIQMGSDTFTVDSNKLGVANGAATINATQAELKKMLPAKK